MAYATEWTEDVRQKLLAPFAAAEVKFLPRGGGQGENKMGMPYVDARVVMHRLDDVFGPGGWSFTYDIVPGNRVMVRGSLVVLGILKCDAGEASDEAEPLKSAVSDALKRCAVHFGVGRFLYALGPCWGKYDGQRKTWVKGEGPKLEPANLRNALGAVGYTGQIPAASRAEAQSAPSQDPPRTNGNGHSAPPESSGDRAATNGNGDRCPECHAPAGKHGTKCSRRESATPAEAH